MSHEKHRFLQNKTEPFSNQNGNLHQTIQSLKNDNQLLVEVKKIYGVDRVYPACSKSIALSKLIGKKTFSKQEVNIIREELGYILKHKTYEV